MKNYKKVLSVLLVFVLILSTGCAAKKTADTDSKEPESSTDYKLITDSEKIVQQSEKIIEYYESVVDNSLEDNRSNAEANELITECADKLYAYADDLLDVVLNDISEQYDNYGEAITVEQQKMVSSVKKYASYYRGIYENTADDCYTDIIHFTTGFGTAGAQLYAKYYFSCAEDYLRKMISLSTTVVRNETQILTFLNGIENEIETA